MADRQASRIAHRAWPREPHRDNGSAPCASAQAPAGIAPTADEELVGETFAARMLRLGEGETLQDQVAATSVVLVGVAGCLQVSAGNESFGLVQRDVLTIPQGMSHSAFNAGPNDAVFAAVRSLEDEPVAAAPLPAAHQLSWATYRREFRSAILPRAEIFGHHRLSGPHTPLRTLLGHAVRVPPNQASPWHEVPRDLLFVQIDGEIDFASAGAITTLQPADLLLVRAGTPYSYANHGFSDALFFDVGGRILTAGATSTYYEDDPGWPVQPEVKTFKIVTDDPAFKAIYGS
jgi:quercetin dioxygenase-like cupin family protein